MAYSNFAHTPGAADVPAGEELISDQIWDQHPENPYNWSNGSKAVHVMMLSLVSFLSSIAASIVTPAVTHLGIHFGIASRTTIILTLTVYVIALAFGPVIGGPLSEALGRQWIYRGSVFSGALFTIGAARAPNFAALCFFRFLAGFCWGPTMAIAVGSCSELLRPEKRGPASGLVVLMGFLGPGLGPVIGAYAVSKQSWQWTQYILLIISAAAFLLTLFSKETFHPIIRHRLAGKKSLSRTAYLRHLFSVSFFRPIRMLLLEPIVTLICLYVAVGFGILFSFFAAVPYVFMLVYGFDIEQCGLVFLAVVIGCILGLLTIILCDKLLYQPRVKNYAPQLVPPEHRLYGAMVGSLILPVGLFWFGWSAGRGASWASPATAIVLFAWGNICIFISTFHYKGDVYQPGVLASAASANSLARYGFAAAFPLFTIQMYQKLGIEWASSLLGLISLIMLPVPWIFFKFGQGIRERSKYDTIKY
ncbi:unnamed protein product [Clonostachys chloroleuca]|uniref:Major facilitator superfamily (MFS) profile domain-containing protein n=1 Tax=Clonostachys chloroleuca TaxID=1926264 RepID=A0AA35Q4A8_9HYPO|nr:unnamed protein product [Clonostachys chloroleuca]CAI6097689.1 unnamed protein product [Clonostachys chloroleuca]